jgi:hypothetical protein
MQNAQQDLLLEMRNLPPLGSIMEQSNEFSKGLTGVSADIAKQADSSVFTNN